MFSSGVTPGVQLGADAAGTAIAPVVKAIDPKEKEYGLGSN